MLHCSHSDTFAGARSAGRSVRGSAGNRSRAVQGNLTALVGSLFPADRARRGLQPILLGRESGVVAIGVCRWLAPSHYGFHAAFLVCFVAMALVVPHRLPDALPLYPIHQHETESHHAASERDRIATILGLLPVAVVFFCAFYQSGSSLTLFAKNNTRDTLMGISIAPRPIRACRLRWCWE